MDRQMPGKHMLLGGGNYIISSVCTLAELNVGTVTTTFMYSVPSCNKHL